MGIDESEDLIDSGKDDEITRPRAWSPICFTADQASSLFPQSSHIFAAFAESPGEGNSEPEGADSKDAENIDAAPRVSSCPPTAPTAMRIVNSLISLRRHILEAFSCDNDREAGTSTEVRKRPGIAGVFEFAGCRLGLSPPPPNNGLKNELSGVPPPGPPPTNMTLG